MGASNKIITFYPFIKIFIVKNLQKVLLKVIYLDFYTHFSRSLLAWFISSKSQSKKSQLGECIWSKFIQFVVCAKIAVVLIFERCFYYCLISILPILILRNYRLSFFHQRLNRTFSILARDFKWKYLSCLSYYGSDNPDNSKWGLSFDSSKETNSFFLRNYLHTFFGYGLNGRNIRWRGIFLKKKWFCFLWWNCDSWKKLTSWS